MNKKFNLNEELRDGYTVSKKMKKVWLTELNLLHKFDDVCRKYNLNYFVDSGTLLGAVRHKGFIPWDDDIDLVMKRKDYDKLCALSEEEFESPYFFQTFFSDIDYIRAHIQIRNSQTTGCSIDDKDKPFNRGIFIDIFPLDNIPDNKLILYLYKIKVRFTWMLIHYSEEKNRNIGLKKNIFLSLSRFLIKIVGLKNLYIYYEKLCSKYNDKRTKRLGLVAWGLADNKYIWSQEWFEDSVELEFEDIIVPAPVGYKERLKAEYGEYMVPVKAPTEHGTMIFEPDISYNEYFSKLKTE